MSTKLKDSNFKRNKASNNRKNFPLKQTGDGVAAILLSYSIVLNMSWLRLLCIFADGCSVCVWIIQEILFIPFDLFLLDDFVC